jgi:hypothetical protein
MVSDLTQGLLAKAVAPPEAPQATGPQIITGFGNSVISYFIKTFPNALAAEGVVAMAYVASTLAVPGLVQATANREDALKNIGALSDLLATSFRRSCEVGYDSVKNQQAVQAKKLVVLPS